MNNLITITNLTIEKCTSFEYPVLHIENSNGDKSYLMLFRFTHMQMCGTPSGKWSKGESTFRSVIDTYMHCDREYLFIAICEALNSYMKYTYGGHNNPVIRFTYKGKCYKNNFNEKNDNKEVEGYFEIEDLPYLPYFIDLNLDLIKNHCRVA